MAAAPRAGLRSEIYQNQICQRARTSGSSSAISKKARVPASETALRGVAGLVVLVLVVVAAAAARDGGWYLTIVGLKVPSLQCEAWCHFASAQAPARLAGHAGCHIDSERPETASTAGIWNAESGTVKTSC